MAQMGDPSGSPGLDAEDAEDSDSEGPPPLEDDSKPAPE